MKYLFHSRWIAPLLIAILISWACNALNSSSNPGELTMQQDILFGPGPFIYTDTRAGLADLSSYKSSLIMTFDGTRDGQAEKWSKTYVMLSVKDPQARQWTIEKTGDFSNLDPVFLAEMDGVGYARGGEEACNATAIGEGDSLTSRLELASLLTGVIGADEAGQETVNTIAATHYTFDQRALGEQDLTESTGEMWVASEGGYIVKYLLTSKGKSDYFGEGLEGTLALDYELTDPDKAVTITLPEDCPPGMVDAPQLQNASNLTSSPGLLTYDTSTSLADAIAFYQKELEGLGWKAQGDPGVSESRAILNYTQSDQTMSVIITAGNGITTVQIMLIRSQK